LFEVRTETTKMSDEIAIGAPMPGRKRHPSVTLDRVAEMCERRVRSLDNPGICFACGCDADSVEPDARRYVCETCGQPRVYGCENALLMLV
jgi:hypothetical protein